MSIKTKRSCRFTVPWHRIHAQARDASAAGTGRWGWGRCGGSAGRAKPAVWHSHTQQTQQDKSLKPEHKWCPYTSTSSEFLGNPSLTSQVRAGNIVYRPPCSGSEKGCQGLVFLHICLVFIEQEAWRFAQIALKCLPAPWASWRQTEAGCRFRSFKANILQDIPPPDCLLTPGSSNHFPC